MVAGAGRRTAIPGDCHPLGLGAALRGIDKIPLSLPHYPGDQEHGAGNGGDQAIRPLGGRLSLGSCFAATAPLIGARRLDRGPVRRSWRGCRFRFVTYLRSRALMLMIIVISHLYLLWRFSDAARANFFAIMYLSTRYILCTSVLMTGWQSLNVAGT